MNASSSNSNMRHPDMSIHDMMHERATLSFGEHPSTMYPSERACCPERAK